MAKRLDPTAGTQKWKQNLSAAGPAMQAGIQAVTVSPTEQAAAAVDRQVAGVQAAAASGKTAARLRRVSLSQWQQAAISKGVPRLATGAAAGASKYQDFANRFYPVMQSASDQAKALPKGGIENALARIRVVLQAAKSFGDSNQ